MFFSNLRKTLAIFVVFYFSCFPAGAQQPQSMILNLKSDEAGLSPQNDRLASLGEFRISMASQMLDPQNSRFGFSRFDQFADDLVLQTRDLETGGPFRDTGNFSPARRMGESQDLGSTLTLTAIYFQDEFGRQNNNPQALGARKNLGRWAVYGEIGRGETFSRIRWANRKPDPANIVPTKVLMNVSEKNPGQIPPKTAVNVSPTLDESEIPTINNYYLEAIYNFRPSLKGKVSYKRSKMETLESDEKLQVEGIVDAGRDVQIKAGYRNQTMPDLTNEPKQPNNTKVWTEFILKF